MTTPHDRSLERQIEGVERAFGELGLLRDRAACERALGLLPPELAREVLLRLVERGERRLARFGYDLHDGPLQELLVLADDLRVFREQLGGVLGERAERAIVLGRVDDLDGRLVELEASLRRISTAAHASALAERPFAEALDETLDAFAARSGIVPSVRLQGDPAALSASQRIALLSVVGEALNNVREHARGARSVTVEIDCDPTGAGARVDDDGCGFDVEQELVSAARRGRMGLAGIHERVRLLGGRCVVDSRPGGPTTVSLRLPRWESPAASRPATVAPASKASR